MLLIRRTEERILEEMMKGKLASTMCHVSIGQEAVAAGVCDAMAPQDYLTSTHRGHGHFIARGGGLGRMMAELFGKETGYCKGRGGSMHITDITIGHLGANGIVGGHLGIAAGAALWSQISSNDAVTVCFFGEGATNEGITHESLNMAALWKLPVVFVVENNHYAMSLAWERSTAQLNFTEKASAYGIPGVDVDGQDALAVQEVAKAAIDRARRGEGPTLIGAHTYRFLGHSRADPSKYRSSEEEERERARDPLTILRTKAGTDVITDSDLEAYEAEVKQQLDDAVKFAEDSPLAQPSTVFEDIYA
ncbi:MAG: thiamine pyrophosphate-dependent dehydrogenase E1 component subunit alpha [Anaerolineae bacterium]|nr:thiamine pyrophosphate-dependent dehydrogenase E1 component subunit alpha [Anaerolineae bacterium]